MMLKYENWSLSYQFILPVLTLKTALFWVIIGE